MKLKLKQLKLKLVYLHYIALTEIKIYINLIKSSFLFFLLLFIDFCIIQHYSNRTLQPYYILFVGFHFCPRFVLNFCGICYYYYH